MSLHFDESLLETAHRGDLPLLIERLHLVSSAIHATSTGGMPLKVGDQLIDEALTYARLGDLEEAKFRLRLRAEPKFSSIIESEHRYELAMAKKRGVA